MNGGSSSRLHAPAGDATRLRLLLKPVVFLVCLLPLASLIMTAVQDGLGANPVEAITAWSGQWTLRMLLVTLAMSPLRQWFAWRWPLQIRRMLGLFTFFYVCLHFLTFVWFDHAFLLMDILGDIIKKPYITVGFIAWCVLLALAVTSNSYSVRRLRRGWQRLHRGAYLAALGGIVHYMWLVKADYSEPMLYLGICTLLFLTRLVALLR
ncbi:MAG: sulfoxide reductase heme-binding subunit YedZ [Gammaproteobacteria bacterium]|nr:sulfoxide reductase heme-binding subunit YedZ [Gammaproteobacteria bacterium]